MSENNLPDIVAGYMAAMLDIMQQDPQMKAEILENEMIDQATYWQIFESKAMINYAENGDPALTPEQFKQVMVESMKASMEDSLQKLVGLGLVEETEDGFKATPELLEAWKRSGGNQG